VIEVVDPDRCGEVDLVIECRRSEGMTAG